MSAPLGWTLEVWNAGASVLIETLTHPIFTVPPVDRLCQVGTFKFKLAASDAQAPACDPRLGREVRLYRGAVWSTATYRWAGRIWDHSGSFPGMDVEFSCYSILDYATDRYIDRGAQRVNLLLNAGLEAGAGTDWATFGTGVTATIISTDSAEGTYSVQLDQATDSLDSGYEQDVTGLSAVDTVGDLIAVGARYKIVSWTGPALNNYGLIARIIDGMGTVVTDGDGRPIGFGSADVDYHSPRGEWTELETSAFLPFAGGPYTLQVKGEAIAGRILWDDFFAGRYESLSLLAVDQATIVVQIIAFIQDATKNKNNLNITTSCPATGVIRSRTYQYADHTQAIRALQEFATLINGMEFEITPTRVFTTYAINPATGFGMGTDKTGTVTLTVSTSPGVGNCEPKRHEFDGHSAGNDITALADGSGPARDEFGSVDNTLFGGVTVQQILSPPSTTSSSFGNSVSTPVDLLAPWAQRQLKVFRDPTAFELLVTDRDLGYTLRMGDRVTLTFDATTGYFATTGPARIVQLSPDPNSDLVTVVLNRVPA